MKVEALNLVATRLDNRKIWNNNWVWLELGARYSFVRISPVFGDRRQNVIKVQ